jgi:hypothetical protein
MKELNKKSSLVSRKEYMYQKYCANLALTHDDFIECVKSAYYKYNAPLYNPLYEETLLFNFTEFFKSLKDEGKSVVDIVDIGAGTGQGLKLVKAIGYKYNKYFFLEPFKSMSDQCDSLDDAVIVVNGYIDDLYDVLLKEESRPRVFIICAVLRTISNMSEFLTSLKRLMRPGDICFFPIEPNNHYFCNSKFMLVYKIKFKLNKLFGLLKKKLISLSKANRITSSKVDEDYLSFVISDLKKTGVVKNSFTKDHVMAVVYYHNYLYWINELNKNPGEWNEGFFNVNQVAEVLDCEINIVSSNFIYGIDFFGISTLASLIDRFLDYIQPGKGSTLSVILTKR